MSSQNDYIHPSSRWQTVIGILPFLGFGVVSMIGKVELFNHISTGLSFYLLALSGLLFGWSRGFPAWSYSYLGWSIFFAWWWLNGSFNGVYWGRKSWIIFGIMIVIGLILTRSLDPIKKLFRDISNDWTRLSLAMYTFIAFVFLVYDENHHPYLFVFMAVATLAIAAGAWFFLRSASMKGRMRSVLGGLFGGYTIGMICDRTWDAAAYYNLPEGPPDPWHQNVFRTILILAVLAAILLWPVLIALAHRIVARRLIDQ
jgi:hypothetical protein